MGKGARLPAPAAQYIPTISHGEELHCCHVTRFILCCPVEQGVTSDTTFYDPPVHQMAEAKPYVAGDALFGARAAAEPAKTNACTLW